MSSQTPNTHNSQQEKCLQGSLIFKNYLDMPVWQLRHLEVSRFIDKHGIKRVLDIGCAEGTLINRLSRSSEMELLIGIDFNKDVLSNASSNVQPQMVQENIGFNRDKPLVVQLYHLNVFENLPLQRFKDIELVTMIQFIEHVKEQDLPKLSQQVFKNISPKFVIITTPNQEFNVHFKFKEEQMRHPQHLFEWKRSQFQDFVRKICNSYDYEYQLFGVGEHSSDNSQGFCSQGAYFTRKCGQKNEKQIKAIQVQSFCHIQYPFWKDRLQQKIEGQIRDLIAKNNYVNPLEILQLFQETKIGKKIINYQAQNPNSDIKIEMNKQWIIQTTKRIKYCGYDPQRQELFYEYTPSDMEGEEEMI